MARGRKARGGKAKKERPDYSADKRTLMAFMRDIDQAETTAENAGASLKDAWNNAKEGRVHVKAAKLARRMRKLTPLEQSEFLRCFAEYCEHLGVGAQEELPLSMEEEKKGPRPIPNTPPITH